MEKLIDVYKDFMHWFGQFMQTRRTIILPVPIAMAAEKLKIAFLCPIDIPRGFFKTGYYYTGEVNDTDITISFVVHSGRSRLEYRLRGKLFQHNNSSQLVLIVNDETAGLFLWLPFFFCFSLVCMHSTFIAIFAFIPLLVFVLLMMGWHRQEATNSVEAMLYKIIASGAGTIH